MECHGTDFRDVGFIGQVVAQQHRVAFVDAGDGTRMLRVVGDIQGAHAECLQADFRQEIHAVAACAVTDDLDPITGRLQGGHAPEGEGAHHIDADVMELRELGVKQLRGKGLLGKELLQFRVKGAAIVGSHDEEGRPVGPHKAAILTDGDLFRHAGRI